MSSQPIVQHHRLGRRVGLLVAAVFTAVVTGGAGFAPPDDDLVSRVLTDPADTLSQVADDAGLAQPAAAGQQLMGLFKVNPTSCTGGPVTGSYFRMIQPGGSRNGPWVENNDSTCSDKSYTDLAPGTDGGLSTTGHQPNPDPAFDAAGSGTSGRITAPKSFYGTKFATSTNPKDPQTGKDAPVPTVVNDNGKLSGNLAAFAAAWNRQHFNQGSPKPDNSKPGLTAGPTGTYDAATKHFVLEWSSTIVGGAFNNFTGVWRLEGTFQPAGGKASRQLAATQVTVAQTGGGALKGLFRVNPASCSAAQVSGSYFRMIQPGGTKDGPWVSNNDSVCADKTYTDLTPGRDGGLSTTGFQPQPGTPFDMTGSGTADRIIQPKGFFGTKFAAATNQQDPQTNSPTTVPEVVFDGTGKLSGNLSAYAAAWNNQHFNQGAPKPDGSKPGLTSGPDGTFDPTTRKFTLEWTTTIVGGPFNNFTGKWHFEGVYEGALPAAVNAPSNSGGSTTTAPAAGGSTGSGSASGGSASGGSASSGSPKSSGGGSTAGKAAAPVAKTAADSSTTTGAAMARTGLRLSPSLPAALIAVGLICRRLSRRPRARR